MWVGVTSCAQIQTFMQESAPTAGSITSSDAAKRAYARESMAFNVKDKQYTITTMTCSVSDANRKFCALFPDLVEAYETRLKNQATVRQHIFFITFSTNYTTAQLRLLFYLLSVHCNRLGHTYIVAECTTHTRLSFRRFGREWDTLVDDSHCYSCVLSRYFVCCVPVIRVFELLSRYAHRNVELALERQQCWYVDPVNGAYYIIINGLNVNCTHVTH